MSRRLFGWDLPPGVSQRDIDEAYGVEDEDIEAQERKAMTKPSISAEQYESLQYELGAAKSQAHMLGEALAKLQKAAQELIDAREKTSTDLQEYITDLEEAIPCEACLEAPCVCPD